MPKWALTPTLDQHRPHLEPGTVETIALSIGGGTKVPDHFHGSGLSGGPRASCSRSARPSAPATR